jgi:hypothetical protein
MFIVFRCQVLVFRVKYSEFGRVRPPHDFFDDNRMMWARKMFFRGSLSGEL